MSRWPICRRGSVLEANPAARATHGDSREGFHRASRGGARPPRQPPRVRQLHPGTVRSGAAADTRALHVRRDGSTFHAGVARDGVRPIRAGRRPLGARPGRCHPARSRRTSASASVSQPARGRQAALLGISHVLASTLELQPGLVLEQLRGIIEYAHAALFRAGLICRRPPWPRLLVPVPARGVGRSSSSGPRPSGSVWRAPRVLAALVQRSPPDPHRRHRRRRAGGEVSSART